MDFPDCLLLFLSIPVFYFFSFSVLHFLVVGPVRQIHVGFRAHVKIAFRIVSYTYRIVALQFTAKRHTGVHYS